jgi:hypothetical protein
VTEPGDPSRGWVILNGRLPRSVAQNRPAKVQDDLADLAGCHVVSLVRASAALYLITTRSRPVDAFFLTAGRPTNQPF